MKMGFNDKWIHWMNMCVVSIDYSTLVNNESVGPVIPGKGLHQGDPLSTYLFIICAEAGLPYIIRDAEDHGVINGTWFKDLSFFNLEMLGKQGWKFLSEPHSLVSRIFNVKYFSTKKLSHSHLWS